MMPTARRLFRQQCAPHIATLNTDCRLAPRLSPLPSSRSISSSAGVRGIPVRQLGRGPRTAFTWHDGHAGRLELADAGSYPAGERPGCALEIDEDHRLTSPRRLRAEDNRSNHLIGEEATGQAGG